MGDGDSGEVRYRAFLSYSHKDAAAAGRLHRRLEAYRIPGRLVGRETSAGRVPARLWPIFRDREELPAATDLSETVRAALARSDALVILCSPNAVASLWVAEEIRVFRELHPARPILAAILEGDAPDCFPELLRALGEGHEPLATDLRRERDGARLGLLKLVAGITGLGLDDLVQRDATRRVRRVTAVTAGAVVAMLGMTALAVVAVTAQREAERQQAEAEGQIEFMLTDLRTRLRESDGRLAVMAVVNRRALGYYDRQNPTGLSADSLERRARILQAMGEDYVQAAELDSAMTAFRQAHRITAEQLAREPVSAQRIFAHGQSDYWVGHIYQLRRDWPRATDQFARYKAAAERLIAIDPQDPDYMLEMAWGASNMGVVQRDGDRDQARAEASFRQAIDWFRRAIRARPRDVDRQALANAYGDLADTFHARGLWHRSLEYRLRQYEITAPLQEADPDNVEKLYGRARAERALARMSDLAGDSGRVRLFQTRAYERSLQLTARDPGNAEWRLFRLIVECDLLGPPLRLPSGVSEGDLLGSIARTRAILAAQRNPRLSEVSICLGRVANRRGLH